MELIIKMMISGWLDHGIPMILQSNITEDVSGCIIDERSTIAIVLDVIDNKLKVVYKVVLRSDLQ